LRDYYTPIDGGNELTFGQMMGGFKAPIPREFVDKSIHRTATEHAQMQLLQQLNAAVLNSKYCNGCFVDADNNGATGVDGKEMPILTLISNSKDAFNSGSIYDLHHYAGLLDTLNNDYHVDPFPVSFGNADPKGAKLIALEEYWDDSITGALP
jgi:hypothetical protein